MSHSRQGLETEGSEDSHARALWAAGVGRSRNEGHAAVAGLLFERGLAAVATFSSPRAWAFSLLGIHEYQRRFPKDARTKAMQESLTANLGRLWKAEASENWPWFEPSVTYDNALEEPGAKATGAR